MNGDGQRLVPTQLAAMAVGVREATIRKWASRGKITRHGSSRRALYDLDELLDVVAQESLDDQSTAHDQQASQ